MAKEHLEFDLEFLDSDKTEDSKTRPHYQKETFPSRREKPTSSYSIGRLKWWWVNKTRRKKVEFIIGAIASLIILGTIVIVATTPDDSSSISSSGNSTPSTVPITTAGTPTEETYKFTDENGKVYYCSLSNNAKATTLEPSDFEKSSIESDQSSVDLKESELNRLKSEIDSMYVNEYSSQFLINRYNNLIDDYNLKHSTYERQFNSLDAKIDSYNQKVETYNNFLRNNCSPN